MIGSLLARRKVPLSFRALNNHDIDAFLKDWDEDVTLVYTGDIPGVSGTYEGKAAVRDFYKRDFAQFPHMNMVPKHVAVTNPFDMIGNNVLAVHWDADVTNRDGYRIQNSGVTILKIKRGRVVHAQMYIANTGEDFRKAWGMS